MSTVPFTLRLDEEIKLQLEEEAVADARSASYIAAKAIKQYLDARNLERLAMEEAVQEADKGAFVSSGAMRNWIASWGSDAELSPPAADVFLREKKTWRSQVVINTKDSFFVALPSD